MTTGYNIEAVEARLREWRSQYNDARANYRITSNPRFLTEQNGLADKIAKAERFLSEYRVKNS